MSASATPPRPDDSSAEEPRTPIAVREILSQIGEAVEEAQAMIAKAFPGGEELLNGLQTSLNRAAVRLLEKSHEYEARVAELDQQEREREAAANPLVRIVLVFRTRTDANAGRDSNSRQLCRSSRLPPPRRSASLSGTVASGPHRNPASCHSSEAP